VYERFVPAPAQEQLLLVESAPDDFDGLDRLDPVCLMEVDPATAKHTVQYGGRTIAFCAPSCKKRFTADPGAYISS
jgi:YHS domain-containing protein